MMEYEISLRNIKEKDLEKIMQWRMSPEVTKFMFNDLQLTMEKQLEWLKSIKEDESCRHWVINYLGTDIGVLGLTRIDYKNKRCCWQWYIGELEYRGKGIAQQIQYNIYDYVFYKLCLNRLYSEVFATNIRNLKAYEKSGYFVEGILKEHVYKNWQFHDVAICGITKMKWEEIRTGTFYEKIFIEEQ